MAVVDGNSGRLVTTQPIGRGVDDRQGSGCDRIRP